MHRRRQSSPRCHRAAEVVASDGVGALQLGRLFPDGRPLGEHIRPAGDEGVAVGSDEDGRPEMATDMPNQSPATVSEPFNSAVCFQTATLLVNTYARPPPAWPSAPTMAVVPEIATRSRTHRQRRCRKLFNSAACFQPIEVLVNT